VKLRKAFLSLIGAGLLCGLAGCGLPSLPSLTSITQPVQPISILFVEAPPATMAVNASATIYAVVENSSSNSQVNYAIACGSKGACGSFSASDEGGAIVYTAPAAIPSGTTVTITATAAADTAKSVSATITIVPPIPISVTLSAAMPASLQVNSTVSFNATIANDTSANPQVAWTVTCGSAECGSFNPATTASYVATTYTAPAAIPFGGTVTVTATSVTDSTKSASASITITAQAPTLANGTYVYQLSGGVTGINATFVTGVLVAQNGAITGGEQDSIDYATDYNSDTYNPYPYAFLSGEIGGGSYSTTPDGNLQITLWIEGGEETLNGVLAPGGKGFVAQLYGSQGSGTLDLQTSTTAPAGGYAVSMYGGDQYGEQAWIGGILNVDSAGGISGTGSVLDSIVAGNYGLPSGKNTLAASTVSAPDNFGRVQFVLNPGVSSALPVQVLIGYIVDATHIRLISAPLDNSGNYQGVAGGLALGQGASTGTFSNASLAGTSYVFGASTQIEYGMYQVAGAVTANADGTLTGALNWNDLTGNSATPLPVNGSWTIDSTGRATLSNLTDGSAANLSFTDSLHLYLTGDGNALLLSSQNANPFAGQAFQQQSSAFTAASLSGNYGLNAGVANPAGGISTAVGSVAFVAGNETDTLAGFADSGNGAADFAISGSLTPASNGVFTGTLTGLDAASRATPDNFTFYLVDSTRAVAIETGNKQLTLGYLELQP
jgi:hypothetical protein